MNETLKTNMPSVNIDFRHAGVQGRPGKDGAAATIGNR